MASGQTTSESMLGHFGPVQITLAQTEKPWDLDVDTFLLSMGNTYGGLAQAIRQRYPRAPWNSVDLLRLRPNAPEVIRLTPESESPRWAILGTVHPDPSRQPTEPEVLAAIPVALESALAAAGTLGGRSLLVPLLGAGRLGVPERRVAAQIVTSLRVAADKLGPSRIVLLAQTPRDAALIQDAWTTIVPRNLPTAEVSEVDVPPPQPSDLSSLQPSALAALAYADALRRALGLDEAHMEHLVLGLDQDPSVHRRLEGSGLPRETLLELVEQVAGLTRVPSVTPQTLDELPPLSANASSAVSLARYLSGLDGDGTVEAGHLLQGALSVDSSLIDAMVQRAPLLRGTVSNRGAEPAPTTVDEGAVEAELIGGVAADLVDPEQGIPLEKDDLGLSTYVTMMATAIARKDTQVAAVDRPVRRVGVRQELLHGPACGQVKKLATSGGDYHNRRSSRSGSTRGATRTRTCGRASATRSSGPWLVLPRKRRRRTTTSGAVASGCRNGSRASRAGSRSSKPPRRPPRARSRNCATELERRAQRSQGSARGCSVRRSRPSRPTPTCAPELDDAWSKLGHH